MVNLQEEEEYEMNNLIYLHSITTTLFTTEGNLILLVGKDKKLDTPPMYFFGNKKEKNYQGENGIEILNTEKDYCQALAYCLALHDKRISTFALQEGFLRGNGDAIQDFGKLYKHIAPAQIEEMQNSALSSFIRIQQEKYEIIVNQKPMINEIERRFVVIPGFSESEYQNMMIMSLEEIKYLTRKQENHVTQRVIDQMSNNSLENIQYFSNQLRKMKESKRKKR